MRGGNTFATDSMLAYRVHCTNLISQTMCCFDWRSLYRLLYVITAYERLFFSDVLLTIVCTLK